MAKLSTAKTTRKPKVDAKYSVISASLVRSARSTHACVPKEWEEKFV